MSKAYAVVGHSRELMIFDEQKLYEKLVLLEAPHVSGRLAQIARTSYLPPRPVDE